MKELKFASEDEALQHLSDITNKSIKIANSGFISHEDFELLSEIKSNIESAKEFEDSDDLKYAIENLQFFKKRLNNVEYEIQKLDNNYSISPKITSLMQSLKEIMQNAVEDEDLDLVDDMLGDLSIIIKNIKELDDLLENGRFKASK